MTGASVHKMPEAKPPRNINLDDFDEAEKAEDPLTVTFKGKTYELPSDAPLRPVLKSIRDGGELSDEEAFGFLDKALGTETLDQLAEDGLGVKGFTHLAYKVLAEYGLEGKSSGDPKSPPA